MKRYQARVATYVHTVCYHGHIEGYDTDHPLIGEWGEWSCDHHHGEDQIGAIECARQELDRRNKIINK